MDTRDGVASLLQIQAKSTIERDHMYGKDTLDLFKATFKNHTNFDKHPTDINNSKSILQYSETDTTNADFGDTIVFNVDTKQAEMIGHLIMRIRLPDISQYKWDNQLSYQWTNDIGYAMIEYVKIINGDEELVSYSGNYLHIYSLLNVVHSKRNGMSSMIGHYNTRHSLHGRSRTLYIPIPFMESRDDRQYYPLFISSAQTFQIRVKLNKVRDLVYVPSDQSVHCSLRIISDNVNVQIRTKDDIRIAPKLEARLLFDSFHLTKEERVLFLTRTSHILFQYVQERSFRLQQDDMELGMLLDFSHAVSSIIVCVVPDCALDHNLHFQYEPLTRMKLILNGVTVNKSHYNHDKMSADRFRYLHSFTNIPNKWVYVIPFCLSNDHTQPTGYFLFDAPNKKSTLTIERENTGHACTVYVYAITYNKLNMERGVISSVL